VYFTAVGGSNGCHECTGCRGFVQHIYPEKNAQKMQHTFLLQIEAFKRKFNKPLLASNGKNNVSVFLCSGTNVIKLSKHDSYSKNTVNLP